MELNELIRMVLNLVRKGRVSDIDHENEVVRVECGDLKTNWIRWMAGAAGKTSEWLPPSVGDQVVLLAPGGDLSDAVVLQGLYAEDTPPPSHAPAAHVRRYADGTEIVYDSEAHCLTATFAAGGSVVLNAPEGVTVKTETATVEAKTATIKADSINLDAKQTACSGDLSVKGAIKADGDVTAGAISLKSHKHMEQGDGKPTGAPQ